MANTEQNAGTSTEGKPEGSTQEKTVSMSAYQQLQRDLQKTKDTVKQLEAKQREGESVEEQLNRERQEREGLERELNVLRVKTTAPKEIHDVIDRFVAKHGFVPDDEDIELLTSKVGKTQEGSTEQSAGTSGVRNAPASRQSTPNWDDDDYLKSIRLDNIG